MVFEEDKELTLFIRPLALSIIFLTIPFVSMTYAINNIYCHGWKRKDLWTIASFSASAKRGSAQNYLRHSDEKKADICFNKIALQDVKVMSSS